MLQKHVKELALYALQMKELLTDMRRMLSNLDVSDSRRPYGTAVSPLVVVGPIPGRTGVVSEV